MATWRDLAARVLEVAAAEVLNAAELEVTAAVNDLRAATRRRRSRAPRARGPAPRAKLEGAEGSRARPRQADVRQGGAGGETVDAEVVDPGRVRGRV